MKKINVLLCGDFNCRLDNEQDKSSRFLNNLIKQLTIFDVWKNMYPSCVMSVMFLQAESTTQAIVPHVKFTLISRILREIFNTNFT